MKTTVEVSARHIHLNKEDFFQLFGKEEMTKKNDLSQRGEFASVETVEIVGAKNRLTKVRVLGPFRDRTQLEISKTDCYFTGIDAPYLESGTEDGAKVKLVGPKGELMGDFAIVAMRHLHLSTKKSAEFKLSDGDFASIEIGGERSTKLNNIIVRVADNFSNNIHIDTDDANASGITSGLCIEVLIQKRQK